MKNTLRRMSNWYSKHFDNHYLLAQIYYAIGMVIYPVLITLGLSHFNLLEDYFAWIFNGTYLLLLVGTLIIMRKDVKKEFGKPITKKLILTICIGFAILYFFNEFGSQLIEKLLAHMNIVETTSENQELFNTLLEMLGSQMGLCALMGAFLEELIFRYSMMNYIRNKKVAIAVSTISFALMHISAISISEMVMLSLYLTLGFIFSYTYYKTRDIRVSTGMHLLNNGLATLLSLL